MKYFEKTALSEKAIAGAVEKRFSAINNFLKKNPSEAAVMAVKNRTSKQLKNIKDMSLGRSRKAERGLRELAVGTAKGSVKNTMKLEDTRAKYDSIYKGAKGLL